MDSISEGREHGGSIILKSRQEADVDSSEMGQRRILQKTRPFELGISEQACVHGIKMAFSLSPAQAEVV